MNLRSQIPSPSPLNQVRTRSTASHYTLCLCLFVFLFLVLRQPPHRVPLLFVNRFRDAVERPY